MFVASEPFSAASVSLYGGIPPWIVRPHGSQVVSASVTLAEMVNPGSEGTEGHSGPAANRQHGRSWVSPGRRTRHHEQLFSDPPRASLRVNDPQDELGTYDRVNKNLGPRRETLTDRVAHRPGQRALIRPDELSYWHPTDRERDHVERRNTRRAQRIRLHWEGAA
jgi:hypothetical protein